MNLARGWLERCSAHHAICNQQDPDFIPTRLLDVRGPAIRLTLTESKKRKEYTKYCCLSHCWGGVTDMPLLKTTTLKSFVSGIDITTLPRTFQDAILITRQLGVRYLWIDSLCIVQDSAEDWAKEAAVMGKIYQNGHCTISAAEAASGHGGCFVRRNPLNCNPPLGYPSVQPSASGAEIEVDVPAPRLTMVDVFTSKLASRGWVFQEALLSPRILYFGRGLFWNCKAGQASELDPLGRGILHMGMQYGPATDAIFPKLLESSRPGRARKRSAASKKLHREWMRLVATYSRLQLTFENDRLPALAGIAQTVMSLAGGVLKGQYLAGMWKCTLVFDLLWSQGAAALDGHGPRPRLDRNECPSWSWASIGGAVESYLGTWQDWPGGMELFVDIVSATTECDPLDTARTGKVTGGDLTMECIPIPCHVEARKYATVDMVEVHWRLIDGEGKEIGKATPDTNPNEFVDGATFAVPFLRIEDGSEMELHGLVLVQKGDVFARVAKWTATTPKVS
ncbi:heterokaryon incompatibility protein-domain-containing protein [Chaetomium fimeti]|uniref:Heterokaryon incompatibility protein-domain-containing protein n=1 Tax=Chaetomium fimeti TaxID=1854472 RepID=A0AAE0H7Y7_9PEZI|nr:heterokaryon incompatibility protein-domain-containing protein [Chaetomium fimeti]